MTVEGTHCFFACSSNGAGQRPILVHNCHRMTIGAQDALLKPLEDKLLVALLCTTEPEKIRGPIRSRCEHYTVRKVQREEILGRMNKVLDTEGVQHEDDAVLTVIDYSGGHVRDILNRLEMIAQTGAVNLDSVREHLHLRAVTLYYELLLSLGDPKRSIELVEQICEQVTPEEAVTGLVEAAMNSFRLAHGMLADFAMVDRALGKQVYERHGAGTVRLAENFLRSRHITRSGLMCDILALVQQGIPVAPSPYVLPCVTSPVPMVFSPPPVIVAPLPTAAAPTDPVVTVSADTSPVMTAPIDPPLPAPATVPDVPPIPTVVTPSGKVLSEYQTLDKNGNAYIKEPEDLTLSSVDSSVATTSMPRTDTSKEERPLYSPSRTVGESEIRNLGPVEWRSQFERDWRP